MLEQFIQDNYTRSGLTRFTDFANAFRATQPKWSRPRIAAELGKLGYTLETIHNVTVIPGIKFNQ